MQSGGGNADEGVADLDVGAVDDFLLVRKSHAEAGKVIFLRRVEAGHFSGLAADQGAARLHAALRYAAHDVGDLLRDILADGKVIEEEKGLCAAARDVVRAHGNAVDTHRFMLVHEEGDFQLGTHAVSAGDKGGRLHAGEIRLKESAEAAYT